MADELKKKIVDALKEHGQKPRRSRKQTIPAGSMFINGNGNVQAGGDVNINTRKIQRVAAPPTGPEHITKEQAYKLSELVKKACELETKTGKEQAKSRPAWWSKLQNRYRVPSYHFIPCTLGEDAISYMQQEIAKLRPKLRRRDNEAWRKEHYSGIWARAKQLGYDKAWVYGLVEEKIGKKIESLTALGEQDLKKLYTIIMAKKGGALND